MKRVIFTTPSMPLPIAKAYIKYFKKALKVIGDKEFVRILKEVTQSKK